MTRSALLVALLALLLLAPHSAALQGPYLPQTINGGPIIDVSLFGNRELYPGQTTTLQIVVQNSGVLGGLVGYQTPLIYPVTLSTTSSITTPVKEANNSSSESPDVEGLSGPAGQLVSSATMTRQVNVLYDEFELNSGPNVAIAATTALGVTARLSTEGTPLQVVSGECVVGGSLPAGSVSPPFSFIVRVDRGAKPGVYALPVIVTYKHLAGQYDFRSAFGDVLEYNDYVEECVTLHVYVVIREAFDLVVTVEGCQNMLPGSDGMVTLKVSNVGGVCAEETVIYLMPSYPGLPQDGSLPDNVAIAPSLVLPVQGSQYIGRMDPGEEKLVSFKVAVSPDAEAGTYPLSAIASYTDAWGKQKSSNVDTFGVPVQPEMKFTVDEDPIAIRCGRSCAATVNLTNTGPVTAHDAVVRMNALDPFVVSYDTAYLGDVKPGESVNTTFGIKVKPDAVPTTYYVTMEVKYYDDEDDPHVTKIIRKAIVVDPPPTLWESALENWPIVAGAGIVALLGAAYAARGFLKGKKPGNKPQLSPVKDESAEQH
ncbi:COG1361 S-layer family protein [Methanocella conradii]|uniref:COG1361 S-layer family protein n=1 Tax=Methanocella conradii TaxID=1175444 RepID=UPI0024B3C59A|nr:S-layer protein [Methanocella conradii]MDI6896700.1 S-layer protein [Methanocella conradii]